MVLISYGLEKGKKNWNIGAQNHYLHICLQDYCFIMPDYSSKNICVPYKTLEFYVILNSTVPSWHKMCIHILGSTGGKMTWWCHNLRRWWWDDLWSTFNNSCTVLWVHTVIYFDTHATSLKVYEFNWWIYIELKYTPNIIEKEDASKILSRLHNQVIGNTKLWWRGTNRYLMAMIAYTTVSCYPPPRLQSRGKLHFPMCSSRSPCCQVYRPNHMY